MGVVELGVGTCNKSDSNKKKKNSQLVCTGVLLHHDIILYFQMKYQATVDVGTV